MDAVSAMSEARKISLDALFRLVASLLGICSTVVVATGLSRPSQAVEKAARVAGLDLSAQIQAVATWLNAPIRAGVVATASDVLFLGALVFVGLSAHHHSSGGALGTLRGSATAWIAVAAYLELNGDRFDASWLWWMVAILAWVAYEIKSDNGYAVAWAGLELLSALVAAILIPFLWLMLAGPHAKSSGSDEPNVSPVHPDTAVGLRAVPPPSEFAEELEASALRAG